MEWLLSQDEVIFMLYEKIFPAAGSTSTTSGGARGRDATAAASAAGMGEMDFARLTGGGGMTGGGNAPGSLFATSSASQRPQSSTANSLHAQSTTTKSARPQTAGPSSQSRANTGTPQQQSFSDAKSVQYERPLGARPLSGYAITSASANSADTKKQRPHTAMPSSSNAGAQSDYQAEVEAEMRAARRPTTAGGADDDDDGADEQSFDESRRLDGLEEDDDEDGDRQVYEQKNGDED